MVKDFFVSYPLLGNGDAKPSSLHTTRQGDFSIEVAGKEVKRQPSDAAAFIASTSAERFTLVYDHWPMKRRPWSLVETFNRGGWSIEASGSEQFKMTREAAFAKAAELNNESVRNPGGDSLEGCDWWAVVEVGQPLAGYRSISVDADGRGVLDRGLACPVLLVRPTDDELKRHAIDKPTARRRKRELATV